MCIAMRMHDSSIHRVLTFFLRDADGLSKNEITNVMLSSKYCKSIVQEHMKHAQISRRRQALYEIIRILPMRIQCFPRVKVRGEDVGDFAIEKRSDMTLVVHRPEVDFHDHEFELYFTLMTDVVNIVTLVPDIRFLEIQALWGWGGDRFHGSFERIRRIVTQQESNEDDVDVSFDNRFFRTDDRPAGYMMRFPVEQIIGS
jgi:hypothetical protein